MEIVIALVIVGLALSLLVVVVVAAGAPEVPDPGARDHHRERWGLAA